MTNVVEGCAAAGARLVFLDNLYQLGPQTEARSEDMPLSAASKKGVVLTEVTRIWTAARDRVRVAAIRCLDFYGPGVSASHIGRPGFGRVANGKPALLLAPPNTPHHSAYVPDIARAVVTLLNAPDDAFGQVWNMPCAPPRTPREILKLGADSTGVRLPGHGRPAPAAAAARFVLAHDEGGRGCWLHLGRPYQVDARKFTRYLWSDVTPFETGAPATARSFTAASVQVRSPAARMHRKRRGALTDTRPAAYAEPWRPLWDTKPWEHPTIAAQELRVECMFPVVTATELHHCAFMCNVEASAISDQHSEARRAGTE